MIDYKVMYVLSAVIIWTIIACSGQTLPPPFTEKCVHNTYPPVGRAKVPTFVINLDDEPLHRWDTLGKQESAQIGNLLSKFKEFVLSFSKHAQFIIDLVDKDMGSFADSLPAPFGDEMKGLAKASGLPLGEIVLYNIFYEIFTVCTSIIAQDASGTLYHARNLDFGIFMGWDQVNHTWMITEALKPSIVNLDWQRGGKTVFKSVNFAGYIGILTAVKPGIMSLSMNDRFNIDGGFIGIIKWLLGDHSASWMGFLTRQTLEQATSYKQAKDMLANTPLLAPGYFILGGNASQEACVITRSREGPVDVWDIGTRNSTWFLVETNYDHWLPPFVLDDRRTPAINCMREMTQKNTGFAGLFDVLSSKPVLNKLTTYTALMQVHGGQLETYLQYCPDPCFPW